MNPLALKQPNKNLVAKDKAEPPLSHTRLSRLVYILVLLSGILAAFHGYRLMNYKKKVVRERYGWDDKSPMGGDRKDIVQQRIEALAEVLGLPSRDLAIVIAEAVRNYAPHQPDGSIHTGEVTKTAGKEAVDAPDSASRVSGVAGSIIDKVDSFVGLEDPV